MQKIYKIPCSWVMSGTVEIEAESLEKALEIAEDSDLPEQGEFVEGSYKVDHEMIAIL